MPAVPSPEFLERSAPQLALGALGGFIWALLSILSETRREGWTVRGQFTSAWLVATLIRVFVGSVVAWAMSLGPFGGIVEGIGAAALLNRFVDDDR